MRISSKLGTTVLVGALALSATACGSNDDGGTAAGDAPSAAATPAAVLANITGESTAVTLDPAFLKGLTDLKLTPGLVGKTTLNGAVITFPISGGNATYYTPGTKDPYVSGIIKHDNAGLTLTGGGKTVELKNFDVDPGASVLKGDVSVDGKKFADDVELFFLDGRTLQPLKMEGGKPVLEGTTVSLTKTAADALNMVFGVTALTEFFPVGVAKITLAGS